MSAMASQITSLTIVSSNVYSRRRSKKRSKLRVTGLSEENSQVTGEFDAQRASNAEHVSIWWIFMDLWSSHVDWYHFYRHIVTARQFQNNKASTFYFVLSPIAWYYIDIYIISDIHKFVQLLSIKFSTVNLINDIYKNSILPIMLVWIHYIYIGYIHYIWIGNFDSLMRQKLVYMSRITTHAKVNNTERKKC